jgi:myo-inositol 2-dehydrogenase/D-chiro-inositol 1-dehydrogenase
MEALRVGVIGVGRIGVLHARTLLALPGVASVAVSDVAPGRAAAVAADLGAAAATVEELLDSQADALVIAAATPAQAPLLRLAAQAGVPAFCEKPVALDLATLDELADEVERAGVLVQVGFQRRFDAGFRAAREAVAAGALGTLLVLRAATHDPVPPAVEYIAGSGGIFRDLQIHDVDAIRFVTGQDVVDVYADGAVRESALVEVSGDVDVAVAVLRLSGGALAILSGSRYDPLGYDVRLEVLGTGDSIAVGLDSRTPLRSVEPGATGADGPAYANFIERFAPAYREELAAFVDAVREGSASPCPLGEAQAALAVAVAAGRSRAERRPVPIAEVAGAEAVESRRSHPTESNPTKETSTR